jgi:hypothetical protein
MDIDQRNRLRAEAGLSLLNVQAEGRRILAATEQAEFEAEWQRRRSEFADQWVSNTGDGWLTQMARWARARQQVKREMKTVPREGQ